MSDVFTERPDLDRAASIDQRVSSDGGFSLPSAKKKSAKVVSLELVKSSQLRIFEEGAGLVQGKTGGKPQGFLRTYELRDVLSAKVDGANKQILHIWTFKQRLEKKGCCCKSIVRTRILEVGPRLKAVTEIGHGCGRGHRGEES